MGEIGQHGRDDDDGPTTFDVWLSWRGRTIRRSTWVWICAVCGAAGFVAGLGIAAAVFR